MRDCENNDGFVENKVCDVVRESANRYPSYFQVLRDTFNQHRGPWLMRDRFDSPVERSDEGKPEAVVPIFLPQNGFIEFFGRFVDEADFGRHL